MQTFLNFLKTIVLKRFICESDFSDNDFSDNEKYKVMKDQIDKKWDECLARLVVNSGIGAAVGIGASVVLFRRRFFPIPLAVGFSAGTNILT